MAPRQAVAAMGELAQETRLKLFRLLVQRGPDGLAAGVIAERLDVPPSSLTFHLQQLLHAGLVTQRRLGRQIFYAPEDGAMNALLAYLTANCCARAVGSPPPASHPSPSPPQSPAHQPPAPPLRPP